MTVWIIIVAMGVLTYSERMSFILIFGNREVPELLRRALRFVPPAVLSAIVLPAILSQDGALDLSLGNAQIYAGALAAAVAWFTRNMLLTIVVGMAALWVLQAVL